MSEINSNKRPRRRAVVRFSYELLRDILFPKETEILYVNLESQTVFGVQSFMVVVEHPDLPETKPGDLLPEVQPAYRRHFGGEIENEIESIEFLDWGIPDLVREE